MKISHLNVEDVNEGEHSWKTDFRNYFQDNLPDHWFGITNFEMILPNEERRKIDLVLVLEDRIMLVDINNWSGEIKIENRNWFLNGEYLGPSPVKNLKHNVLVFKLHLDKYLKASKETSHLRAPWIEYCMVTAGECKFNSLQSHASPNSKSREEFCEIMLSADRRSDNFGKARLDSNVLPTDRDGVLYQALQKFFDMGAKGLKTEKLRYGGHKVSWHHVLYSHPSHMYAEYECKNEDLEDTMKYIRMWNFNSVSDACSATSIKSIIVEREQSAWDYLSNLSDSTKMRLLCPVSHESEDASEYWEVFQGGFHSTRLSKYVEKELSSVELSRRKAIVESLVSNLSFLHERNVMHLDIGYHCVWIERDGSTKFSNFILSSIAGEEVPHELSKLLSTGNMPKEYKDFSDELTGFQKDVLAVGRLSFHMLTGNEFTPCASVEDIEQKLIDVDPTLAAYKDWLYKSVSANQQSLFNDGVKMQEALTTIKSHEYQPEYPPIRFNQGYSTWEDVSLDSFTTRIFPQDSIVSSFDENQVLVYESVVDSSRYNVVVWKKERWGDGDAGEINLALFLEQLEYIESKGSGLLLDIVNFGLIQDHVFAVHVCQDGIMLDKFINQYDYTASDINKMVKALASSLNDLHDVCIRNGNLKAEDFLVYMKNDEPNLLVPGFVPSLDLYDSPREEMVLDAGQRDVKVAMDVVKMLVDGCGDNDCADLKKLSERIENLETQEHLYLSMNSLVLNSKLGGSRTQKREYCVEIASAGQFEKEVFMPDDGVYHLVLGEPEGKSPRLVIVGASKTLSIFFDEEYEILGFDCDVIDDVKYQESDRSRIGTLVKNKFGEFEAEISIINSEFSRYSFNELLDHITSIEKVSQESISNKGTKHIADAGTNTLDLDEDFTKSRTRLIWKSRNEVEAFFFHKFRITASSTYNEKNGRHFVSCEQIKGDFDFQVTDEVVVEKKIPLTKRHSYWKEIGKLDTAVGWSSKEVLAIFPPERETKNSNEQSPEKQKPLLVRNDVVRLKNMIEEPAREFKQTAVSRIMKGKGEIGELLKFLTPASYLPPVVSGERADQEHLKIQSKLNGDLKEDNGCQENAPDSSQHERSTLSAHFVNSGIQVDKAQIMSDYGLNEGQAVAFVRLLDEGPVGLLQGPPGTGKTKFIASLTHFVVSNGHFRNVLIASVAHEAVNNAAESVLKQFGDNVRLVRVGDEGRLSAKLEPYGTESLEKAYKLQFENEINAKFQIFSKKLGLPAKFATELCTLTQTIKPMLEQIEPTGFQDDESVLEAQVRLRKDTLINRLISICLKMGFDTSCISINSSARENLENLTNALVMKFGITDLAAVDRLREIAQLSVDWTKFASHRKKGFPEFLVHTRQIVASTCVGIGSPKFGLADTAFDLVIVDEAAKCSPGELAVPLQSAKKVILVGDHKQLTPFVSPGLEKELEDEYEEQKHPGLFKRADLFISDFERMFSSNAQGRLGCSLSCQFRMLPPIGKLVSSVFYEPDLTLEHGRDEPQLPLSVCPEIIRNPITWLDTSHLGEDGYDTKEGKGNPSSLNPAESDKIIELLTVFDNHKGFLSWLAEEFPPEENPIGIISGYTSQVNCIQQKLTHSKVSKELRNWVTVGTVDSYQGKENLIVIYSLVKNNKGKYIRAGFLDNPNRMNVALSRAKDKLIIVGSIDRWNPESRLGRVAAQVQSEVVEGNASVHQEFTDLKVSN